MEKLEYIIEQLWGPACDSGHVEIAVNPASSDEWEVVESYWAIPDARRARILLPRAGRRITAAAASNYRRLRPIRKDVLRIGAAAASSAGLPLSPSIVVVRVRKDAPNAAKALPLARLSETLGTGRLYASIGVRIGDNRKATLALVDTTGKPVGYAKFGWDPASDDLVSNELSMLRHVGGKPGATRAPAVLVDFRYFGHPAFVSSPLPMDVRGGHLPLTSQELYHLAPVYRYAPVANTDQFRRTAASLRTLADARICADTAQHARRAATRLALTDDRLPICERWHGDFTWWNSARERGGQLWLWDWESSQPDAVAGLDALHWSFNANRERPDFRQRGLAETLDKCSHHLTAAGLSPYQRSLAAACYALTITERACSLAAHHKSWDSVWISPAHLGRLLHDAEQLIGEHPGATDTSQHQDHSGRPR